MNFFFLSILIFTGTAFSQTSADFEALKKRIDQLERAQEELLLSESNKGAQVNSFLRDNLTLGGFYESAIQTFDGPDTRFQAMNSSNFIGLNIAAEFNPKLRFVSQILSGLIYPVQNPHNDPRAATDSREFGDFFFGAVLTQGYLEFSSSSEFSIQTGIGYAPFGYYPQQRELVLYVRRGGPQVLRTNDLLAALWSGVHLSGTMNFGSRAGYHLYTVNPLDETNILGVGGRLWIASPEETFAAGLSSQVLKYEGHTSEILGADFRLDTKHMVVVSEYVIHMAEENDPWTAYIEPSLKVLDDEVLIYSFADYAQSSRNQTSTTLQDPYTKWEYGGGLNWLPTSYTRLRAGVTFHDYVGTRSTFNGTDRDYVSFDFSVGVAF